jgi:hypothetical protein
MAQTSGKPKSSGIVALVIVIIFVIVIINVMMEEKPQGGTSSSVSSTDPAEEYTGDGLVFSDSFNRALASQDELGVSIVIALDCSGSMGDSLSNSTDKTPKYKLASESLTEVLDFLDEFYRTKIKGQGIELKFGLLRFTDKVKVLYDITVMDEVRFREVRGITSRADVFSPGGKTAIGKTLEVGTEMLAQSGTIFKSLIVITDGENTIGVEPEPVLRAIVENRNNKSTRDFPVLTSSVLVSFVGFDMESDAFQSLGSIGSRVMSAANKTTLNESLKNLFLADITKLEAK